MLDNRTYLIERMIKELRVMNGFLKGLVTYWDDEAKPLSITEIDAVDDVDDIDSNTIDDKTNSDSKNHKARHKKRY